MQKIKGKLIGIYKEVTASECTASERYELPVHGRVETDNTELGGREVAQVQ